MGVFKVQGTDAVLHSLAYGVHCGLTAYDPPFTCFGVPPHGVLNTPTACMCRGRLCHCSHHCRQESAHEAETCMLEPEC